MITTEKSKIAATAFLGSSAGGAAGLACGLILGILAPAWRRSRHKGTH